MLLYKMDTEMDEYNNYLLKENKSITIKDYITVDFTYLYKVKFFDIYKLFVKLTITVRKLYIYLVML